MISCLIADDNIQKVMCAEPFSAPLGDYDDLVMLPAFENFHDPVVPIQLLSHLNKEVLHERWIE